jgi:hypothetical protein
MPLGRRFRLAQGWRTGGALAHYDAGPVGEAPAARRSDHSHRRRARPSGAESHIHHHRQTAAERRRVHPPARRRYEDVTELLGHLTSPLRHPDLAADLLRRIQIPAHEIEGLITGVRSVRSDGKSEARR